VKRLLILVAIAAACASPAPQPSVEPSPEPSATTPAAEPSLGTVRVTASALNVRREPSSPAEVVKQVSKGTRLTLLATDGTWMRVRLDDGSIGFVSAQHVTRDAEKSATTRSRRGCPADSDFRFEKTPTPNLTDSTAHGIVTIDANVDRSGVVRSTKVISNTTGDPALASMAEREIRSAKFVAPVRNCSARDFIYTYRRTF
jgi:uncharacterized protein YgiM (DUF1202 family)